MDMTGRFQIPSEIAFNFMAQKRKGNNRILILAMNKSNGSQVSLALVAQSV